MKMQIAGYEKMMFHWCVFAYIMGGVGGGGWICGRVTP